jgi:hypothetical protein
MVTSGHLIFSTATPDDVAALARLHVEIAADLTRCGYREAGRKVYRGGPLVYYECLIQSTSD